MTGHTLSPPRPPSGPPAAEQFVLRVGAISAPFLLSPLRARGTRDLATKGFYTDVTRCVDQLYHHVRRGSSSLDAWRSAFHYTRELFGLFYEDALRVHAELSTSQPILSLATIDPDLLLLILPPECVVRAFDRITKSRQVAFTEFAHAQTEYQSAKLVSCVIHERWHRDHEMMAPMFTSLPEIAGKPSLLLPGWIARNRTPNVIRHYACWVNKPELEHSGKVIAHATSHPDTLQRFVDFRLNGR